MTNPLSVQKENELLARELGYSYGNPRYKWVYSEHITMPVVVDEWNDASGQWEVVYDYHCFCGVNVGVHLAECNWITPRPKWEIRKMVEAQDQWVFCRWMLPRMPDGTPFDKDAWESTFGGVPYPSSGYYSPVGDPVKCLKLLPGQVPLRQTTELCIQHVKEHFAKTAAQRSREQREQWSNNTEKLREEIRLKCIDAFPVHEGFPGEKHGWSHGGDPNTESPNARPKEPLVTLS